MMAEIQIPALMKIGAGAFSEVALILTGLKCSRPLIVTDAFLVSCGLVSLGGGSPIDTAKAIGLLAANGGRPRDYKVPNPIPKAGPPHIAIPTTAGTGSEVTRSAVISDSIKPGKDVDRRQLADALSCCCRLRTNHVHAATADRRYGHGLPHSCD